LGAIEYINHVQIFENKGSVMGCSRIARFKAQSSLPTQVEKHNSLNQYYEQQGRTLLQDYVQELKVRERIVIENNFVALVPFLGHLYTKP
jgi:UDPglucose--hexose-1-phosphate uridylyltransferase